jgi:RNase adapter protein RapZ
MLIVVTGLSGSGLSTAINTLQDNGFYCFDNIPIELIWDLLTLIESGKIAASGFVLGMDIRDAKFASSFPKFKSELNERVRLDVLYLEADPQILLKRYGATRRRHPLINQCGDIAKCIATEMKLLKPVRESADCLIDTSHLKASNLSRFIEARYEAEGGPFRTLYVTFASFGFKHGLLNPAESIQDIRFLNNPFFDEKLKHKTGLDKAVRDFVMKDKISKELFTRLDDLYTYLIPHYIREGKHFFRIGIGCTGGQHRSVVFAEALAESMRSKNLGRVDIQVVHRDVSP